MWPRNFTTFFSDAGTWGMTSLTACLVFFSFAIYEHHEGKAIHSFYFLVASFILYTIGGYLAYFKVSDRLHERRNEISELHKEFAKIGGPNLFIAYLSPELSGYPWIVIVNNEGELAYNVSLAVPEDGSIMKSKVINILLDDGKPMTVHTGDQNKIDAADIAMSDAQNLPMFVKCRDADCREFLYRFEQLGKLGSGFTLVDKRCLGRKTD